MPAGNLIVIEDLQPKDWGNLIFFTVSVLLQNYNLLLSKDKDILWGIFLPIVQSAEAATGGVL